MFDDNGLPGGVLGFGNPFAGVTQAAHSATVRHADAASTAFDAFSQGNAFNNAHGITPNAARANALDAHANAVDRGSPSSPKAQRAARLRAEADGMRTTVPEGVESAGRVVGGALGAFGVLRGGEGLLHGGPEAGHGALEAGAGALNLAAVSETAARALGPIPLAASLIASGDGGVGQQAGWFGHDSQGNNQTYTGSIGSAFDAGHGSNPSYTNFQNPGAGLPGEFGRDVRGVQRAVTTAVENAPAALGSGVANTAVDLCNAPIGGSSYGGVPNPHPLTLCGIGNSIGQFGGRVGNFIGNQATSLYNTIDQNTPHVDLNPTHWDLSQIDPTDLLP